MALRIDQNNFENNVTGCGPALKKTLLPVNGYNEQSVGSNDNIPGTNSKITFRFNRAYVGKWKALNHGGNEVRGMYVQMQVEMPKDCVGCQKIEFIQVVRTVSHVNGKDETADPVHPTRRRRSGWGKEGKSIGWRVDVQLNSNDPIFDMTEPSNNPVANKMFDAAILPLVSINNRNPGLDYITVAVATMPGGQLKVLGYARWGFYLGDDGQIHSMYKDPPIGTGLPEDALNAIDRWNKFPENKKANVIK
jgi:hypothetical protein